MALDRFSRRGFLGTSLTAAIGLLAGGGGGQGRGRRAAAGEGGSPGPGPALVPSARLRPGLPSGVQAGDVTARRALVWSRSDRPARLWVDWATNDRFEDARTVRGPAALEGGAYTAMVDLRGLPPGEQIVYRARFESLTHPGTWSEPRVGRFRTPPPPGGRPERPVRAIWSADQVGQGWGINPEWGGLRMFETMRRAEPDVLIHSGDIIYADQPLEPEVVLDDGSIWRNVVTPAKSKVAETLDEFRGNYAYYLMDEHVQRFNASVPLLAQWDDHEVVNNWFPGLQLEHDDRYTVKSASLLAARGRQALFEFVPIRRRGPAGERLYRHYSYGPLLDVFLLDLRSYRGPNTPNDQPALDAESALAGAAQIAWLKRALRSSRAAWKVIASDMPIGLVVRDWPRDGRPTYEAWANAEDGEPLGREQELAGLLRFIKRAGIRNTVWVTADVHYAAAHHYSPERAAFTDFEPFWEFVAGPIHAGTFGPNPLDNTFGPEVRFSAVGDGVEPNRPPSAGLQFFGTLDIDPMTRALAVGIHDLAGRELWSVELPAAD